MPEVEAERGREAQSYTRPESISPDIWLVLCDLFDTWRPVHGGKKGVIDPETDLCLWKRLEEVGPALIWECCVRVQNAYRTFLQNLLEPGKRIEQSAMCKEEGRLGHGYPCPGSVLYREPEEGFDMRRSWTREMFSLYLGVHSVDEEDLCILVCWLIEVPGARNALFPGLTFVSYPARQPRSFNSGSPAQVLIRARKL